MTNGCEFLPIKPFESKSQTRHKLLPSDVQLIWAIDTGNNGKLDTSLMIRKILQHFVAINNKILRRCYSMSEYDDGASEGLLPALKSAHVSRAIDVIDIDEEEFRNMIQECTQQQLKYGDQTPYIINLRLLETRLKERYITGRKFLIDSPIEFEFAEQYNIPQIISKINMKHSTRNGDKMKYFENPPNYILNNIIKNKINQQKYNLIMMTTIEQILIALERQKNLPAPNYELVKYMKNNGNLYPDEYGPFMKTKLALKHLEGIWRYLEKLHLIETDKCLKIPSATIETYKQNINENIKMLLTQFVYRHELNSLWFFLSAFRRFLKFNCCQGLSHPEQKRLFDYLQYAEDIDTELIYTFPQDIKLNQAGYAYYHCIQFYKQRCDEEKNTHEPTDEKQINEINSCLIVLICIEEYFGFNK